MKKLLAIAALLLASTAAQAQYTFEYGGRTIRVDPDRGTVQIPGVYDNTGRKAKRSKNEESDRPGKQKSQQAKTDPQAPSDAPATQPAAAQASPAAVPPSPEPPAATAAVAPTDTSVAPPPPAAAPAPPPVPQETTSAVRPAPPPAVAAVPTSPPPVAPKPAPGEVANSPLGIWLTEEKEGKVRIEQCGNNLCGYAVDKKSNQNGEQVLINMKPGKDSKWSGRILDPNSGSTYDST